MSQGSTSGETDNCPACSAAHERYARLIAAAPDLLATLRDVLDAAHERHARLIAAAPDLLATLRDVLDNAGPQGEISSLTESRIRAAIARAEGR